MKKSNYLAKYAFMALLAGGVTFTSCKKEGCTDEKATNYDEKAKKDDGSCEFPSTEEEKSGSITADETWTADKIYYLNGKVVVEDGATLTIEPGTIIKGKEGQETNASALVVARGGKLMAEGTADKPIIFTTELDDIQIGQTVGSNLTKTDNEKWGGVAILGKAPSSTENGDTEGNLEGIPASEGYGKYGGTDAADNSGSLSYVSIRHGGISIGEGNELNGLTLAGVGSGTKISNIEVYATLDDGIECFGGTVDISNALVFFQGDDGIDLDQNYSGTISNFAVIHGDGIGTDEGLEIDGPEGSTYTTGKFVLRNGIVKATGSEGTVGDFKSGAQGTIENVTFDYAAGSKKLKLRTKFDACAHKSDAYKNLTEGNLVFTAVKGAGIVTDVYDGDVEDGQTTACQTELDDANTTATSEIKLDGVGASIDVASTFSWTAAGERGEL